MKNTYLFLPLVVLALSSCGTNNKHMCDNNTLLNAGEAQNTSAAATNLSVARNQYEFTGQRAQEYQPSLDGFEIKKPKLVIQAKNLAGVKIFGTPATSGNVQPVLLGTADLRKTLAGNIQTWEFTPKASQLSLNQMSLVGVDAKGNTVKTLNLPFTNPNDFCKGFTDNCNE